MIVVIGESLIDLFVDASGAVTASLGGGPFNTARTVARLGQPAVYVGRLSTDRFGRLLRDGLTRDGVRLGVPAPTAAPTTLATVDVDDAGVPSYRFYLDGTSAATLDDAAIAAAVPATATAVHVGSLGLVAEPIGTGVAQLTGRLPDRTLLMVDPNCRPAAITRPRVYRARIHAVLRRADVVKVSWEDLAYLAPATPVDHAVRQILAAGPSLVLVTAGPEPVRAIGVAGECAVPVPTVPVVDTVGAGDALGGAFLAWWVKNRLGRGDLGDGAAVRSAVEAAVQVAALTCTRPGADPPRAADLVHAPGWERSATDP